MAVDLSKVMDLADGLEIYKDLRDRIKNIPVPEVPVEDVQINETSILQNGIANIPVAGPNQLGVLKVGRGTRGVNVSTQNNELQINFATAVLIKSGTNSYCPITPKYVDAAAFYGLASAAGKSMSSVSGATVGTYPDEQKQAIQKMLGLDGLFGDYQNGNLASRAYAVGETFIMDGKRYKATAAISDGGLITVGTNCELDPLDGDYIDANAVKSANYGVRINSSGQLYIYPAGINAEIKPGTSNYLPIVPSTQHAAAFYGLAKAAGDTTQALSDNAVGIYTADAKTAILAMLGAVAEDKKAGSGASDLGLVFAHGNNGIGVSEYGGLYISRADSGHIKAGTNTLKPIVPEKQHEAVFYGLAKAAGADEAASARAVGNYTDEAKIAIQKMLGVYEAPWELIREDTVTNETADDVIITVDGNGESFELTDLILQIKVPANANTVIGSYGLVHLFYYSNSDTYIPAMLNAFSGPKQHDWFASIYVKREKNSLMVDYAPYSESGNNRTKNVRNQFDFNYGITQIIKILLRNVQGTITYKLYGKRKWN